MKTRMPAVAIGIVAVGFAAMPVGAREGQGQDA
jgi:hypothetical protein